jgi:metal-responsive CopG/Arc/MetJ family transcriptional regulator
VVARTFVGVRLEELELGRVDGLAAQTGANRSEVIRACINYVFGQENTVKRMTAQLANRPR